MGKRNFRIWVVLIFAALLSAFIVLSAASACTGITLKAEDGTVIYGRSMEWGAFDLNSRVIIIPRNYEFISLTPDGKPGMKFKTKFGILGLDGLEQDIVLDGLNEKGLAVGAFFHPGFASYQKFDPAKSDISLNPADVPLYLLSQYSTVEEVRKGIGKVKVVPVIDSALGMVPPAHWIITEPGGKAIVIEYIKGELKVYDNPLGVITNAPSFDWHLTNLRNYIKLSPVATPDKKIDGMVLKPLGAGSGLIGLPGDFTPPSRFIRAVTFTSTARKTPDGDETIYELFRILDNFNLPLGSVEDPDMPKHENELMRSSTIWTSASDTKNLIFYYHTQNNRRVRKLNMKEIDFNTLKGKIIHLPLDKEKKQDYEEVKVP